jgi:hypothetical protein
VVLRIRFLKYFLILVLLGFLGIITYSIRYPYKLLIDVGGCLWDIIKSFYEGMVDPEREMASIQALIARHFK